MLSSRFFLLNFFQPFTGISMSQIHGELKEFFVALRTWKYWYMLFMLSVGCFSFSTVVHGILIPQHFFAGGVTGLTLFFYDSISDYVSLSVLILLLNIPIFILGYREFSLKYMLTSIIGMCIYSISLEVTEGVYIPLEDPMISAIFGGVLAGFTTGLYLRLGGSVGGLDILGTVLKKRFEIPIGYLFNVINFIVISGNAILYDLESALFTGVFMYIFTWCMQKGLIGFSQRKSVFIISSKPELVAEKILQKMDRGFTYFHASGGYAGGEKRVIYTVINLLELGRLKEYLFETDPDAFIAIQDTGDVIGRRFLTWEEEGFRALKRKGKGIQN